MINASGEFEQKVVAAKNAKDSREEYSRCVFRRNDRKGWENREASDGENCREKEELVYDEGIRYHDVVIF